MSGRIVKVVSLLLCAVLVAVSCLVGCEQDTTPSLTIEELLEVIQEDFPEAHIPDASMSNSYSYNGYSGIDKKIAIGKYEKKCPWFLSYQPSSTDKDIGFSSFKLTRLSGWDETIKLMNTILPVFIENWDESDTLYVMCVSEPNDQFTEWGDEYEICEKSGWRVFALNYHDGMGICAEPIR